jgi:hypothetical protein
MKKKIKLPSEKIMDTVLETAQKMESWTDEILELREKNKKLKWINHLAMELISALQQEKTDELKKGLQNDLPSKASRVCAADHDRGH